MSFGLRNVGRKIRIDIVKTLFNVSPTELSFAIECSFNGNELEKLWKICFGEEFFKHHLIV